MIGLIIILLISGLLVYFYLENESEEVVESKPPISKKEEAAATTELYKVDIKGEVLNPGIYTLESSARVVDVIEKAGGLTTNANTTVINLSKKISDEMVIIIYSNAQVKDFEKTKELEKTVQEQCIKPSENSVKNDACITSDKPQQGKISINAATLEELETLPGIGESKAQDIINYRTTNGKFATIEDIKKVTGIGENLYAKIKDYITL